MPLNIKKITDLLETLNDNNIYEKAIQEAIKKYRIKHFKVERLKPSNIKSLLNTNSKK
jgi:hypothetical protein